MSSEKHNCISYNKHFWCKYVVPNKPMGAIVAIYRPFHMHNNKKML